MVVARGGSAWVVLDKYRCDVAAHRAVGAIEVRLQANEPGGTVPPADAGWE